MSFSARKLTRRNANQFNGLGLDVAGVRKFLADVDAAGISDHITVKANIDSYGNLTTLKAEEEAYDVQQ